MITKTETFPKELEIEDFNAWSFELSDFQKWAIYGLLNDKNVVITAHTGSGKTLPAEWLMQHCKNKGKKLIYTAPIKALSNEKFNKLSVKYPNISFGIQTGDIQFNPTADCLIMTTEVLRNNLFKKMLIENDETLKDKITLDFDLDFNDFDAVIMDEMHYINQKERGPVWEESIIMLPNNIKILGLSATMDNPDKLGNWIEDVYNNSKETWICSNLKRVVPLYHYNFITCQDSILKNASKDFIKQVSEIHEKPVLIKEREKPFDEKSYIKVQRVLELLNKNRCWIDKHFVVERLLIYLKKNNELPALFFIFSRKQCQIFAEKITLNLFEENSPIPNTIKGICDNMLRKLSNFEELICLPEYHTMIKLLEKGIAVHHSGILNPFKEVIEILFSKGYIKLLIATGTMAIGINMPVKTVINHSLTIYRDGRFQYLLPSSYTQMAGRAGRRGIDKLGKIYHLNNLFEINDNNPSCGTYRNILSGKAETLKSKFTIHFNLILRLINNLKNVKNMCSFIEKSMISYEINEEKKNTIKELDDIKIKLEKSQKTLDFLRTDKETLKKYDDLILSHNNCNNRKKKKKIIRDIDSMVSEYKFIENDYKKYILPKSIEKEISDTKCKIENIENYIKDEINVYVKILMEKNFIEKLEDKSLILTEKGLIASNVNEIHCLCLTEIVNNGLFDDINEYELVTILSIFANIKVSDNIRIHNINNTDLNDNIKSIITSINNIYYEYYDIETHQQTSFQEEYNIQYDLCNIIYYWARQSSSNGCLKLCNRVKEKDIFLGDFIKAIMKIKNIGGELEKICEINNNLKLLTIVKKIPELLFKSIVSNESLYLLYL